MSQDAIARYRAYWAERARRCGEQTVGHAAHDARAFARSSEALEKLIFPALAPLLTPSDRRGLDLGCGWGRFTATLARTLGGSAVGLDMTAELLALARPQPGVTFALCPPEEPFPLAASSVDVVFTCTVLQHVAVERALVHLRAEIERVLRPGGLLVLFESVARRPDTHHMRFRSPEAYRALFSWAALEERASAELEGERHALLAGRRALSLG